MNLYDMMVETIEGLLVSDEEFLTALESHGLSRGDLKGDIETVLAKTVSPEEFLALDSVLDRVKVNSGADVETAVRRLDVHLWLRLVR